ncbi:MAG: NAD-dependent epimerase/dehydratase family protein, partial [Planctomycetales bacterium]|nr:NAD-dependent epimerase/dehydratase family protein [Planctomycetales bacterium]
ADPEFSAAAAKSGVKLTDIRKNSEKSIARRVGLRPDCLRVHTVGHDCSIGKMVVSVEVTNGLKKKGQDAKFIATGQTGIMIEGDGLPIDCIVADFVSGSAEKLVLENQHHDILLVEGQGSLVHPSYSGVTLSLLHGCAPQALILCYEIGRDRVTGVESVAIPPLAKIQNIFEVMANIHQRCEVIGIGVNSRRVNAAEAAKERERVRAEFGLPVCDVLRDGPEELVDAVIAFKNRGGWQG